MMAEDYSWPFFWWHSITGPRLFLNGVVDNVILGHSVVISVTNDLPWPRLMQNTIDSLWRQKSKYHKAKALHINLKDEEISGLLPGLFLLKKCAKQTIQHGWREHSRQTLAEYIIKEHVLENTLVWVEGLDDTNISSWVDFVSSYKSKGVQEGIFILEYKGNMKFASKNYLSAQNYIDYVDKNCVKLFASFILASHKEYSMLWKSYISSVVSELCGRDAEVAYALMDGNFKSMNLLDKMNSLATDSRFVNRTMSVDGQHILELLRNGDISTFERCVWKAQVTELFSEIERERISFVKYFYEEIKESISIEDVYQYGAVVNDVWSVELGTLCYLMTNREGAYNQLAIRDQKARDRIFSLHSWRNKLAHMKSLSQKEVNELLEGVSGSDMFS